jgi:hypothetical protein
MFRMRVIVVLPCELGDGLELVRRRRVPIAPVSGTVVDLWSSAAILAVALCR